MIKYFLQQLRLITHNSNVAEYEDCLDLAQILTANLIDKGSRVVVDVAIDQIRPWLNRINRINRMTEWIDVDSLTSTVWFEWLELTDPHWLEQTDVRAMGTLGTVRAVGTLRRG